MDVIDTTLPKEGDPSFPLKILGCSGASLSPTSHQTFWFHHILSHCHKPDSYPPQNDISTSEDLVKWTLIDWISRESIHNVGDISIPKGHIRSTFYGKVWMHPHCPCCQVFPLMLWRHRNIWLVEGILHFPLFLSCVLEHVPPFSSHLLTQYSFGTLA